MGYDYQTQKPSILTDEGQRMFLRIRDKAQRLLKMAGAFRLGEAINDCGGGDSWTMLACVDRLVELGEVYEVRQQEPCAAQFRIFVAKNS